MLLLPFLSLSFLLPSALGGRPAGPITQSEAKQELLPKGPWPWVLKNVFRMNDTAIKSQYDAQVVKPSRYMKNFNDANYENTLLSESARGIVWIIDVYAKSARHGDSMSLFSEPLLKVAETNSSMAGGDLPDYYRFGRLDYLKVDILTTIMLIPKPPLVIISYLPEDAPSPATLADLELRFLRLGTIRNTPEDMHTFLLEEYWKYIRPWKGGWFTPDGPYAFILPPIGRIFAFFHTYTDKIPAWMFLIGSGAFANMLISVLHRPSQKKQPVTWPKPEPKKEAAPAWGSSSAAPKSKLEEWKKSSPAVPTSSANKSPEKGQGKKKKK